MKIALIIAAIAVFHLATGTPVKRDCSGCDDNGVHYEIGDVYVKNCNTYECVADNFANVTNRGCEDPEQSSTCRAVGDTWLFEHTQGDYGYCVDYECFQPANQNTLPYAKFSNLRCRYKGLCLSNGESVDVAGCKTLTCNVFENTVNYTTSDTPNCVGTCVFSGTNTTYNAGESWSYNCYNYTCTGPGTFSAQRACCSVSFNGQTVDYPVGTFHIDGIPCNEYICDADNGFSAGAISCPNSDTGNCDAVGTVTTDGCFTYECTDYGSYAGYSLTSGGCYDSAEGVCRDVGETWTTQTQNSAPYEDTGYCYHKTCSVDGNTYAVSTSSTQCSLRGSCYDYGVTKEYDPAQCSTVTCDASSTSFSALCRDNDGNCHPHGSYGWPYVINGQLCSNCTCNQVGNKIMYSCTDPVV